MMRAKRMTAISAALVILVLAGSTCLVASYTHTDIHTSDITLDGARVILIEGINGIISVTGEEGREKIFLKVVKNVNADDEDEAREISAQMEIKVERSGDVIKLEAVYPKKYRVKRNLLTFLVSRHPKMSMELSFLIPADIETAVTAASGEIKINNMRAPVKTALASGGIEMTHMEGSAAASVSSGKIEVEQIGGDADLKVTSGILSVKDVAGNVNAEISSGKMDLYEIGGNLECSIEYGQVVVEGVGDVQYRGISAHSRMVDVRGSVDASTASGSISFRVKPGGSADYKIIASSGDISLRFLEAMEGGFILKAGTTSGDISVQLPIDIKNVGRNNISGVVRDGKAKIFLETASGDISIAEPGE